jgi:hypothetical protein
MWCQEPPSLKLRDPESVLNATSLTAMLESFWQTDAAFQQLRSKIMWTYLVVVESGVFRTFPGPSTSSSYDPYVDVKCVGRPWLMMIFFDATGLNARGICGPWQTSASW